MPAKNEVVEVRNLTNRAVVYRCSSGRTLHLAPRGGSGPVPAAEVRNARGEKLQARRILAVLEVGAEAKAARPNAPPARRKKAPAGAAGEPAPPRPTRKKKENS
jgi:hypothetical protein